MSSADGGVAVGAFAPASALLPGGSTIALTTSYPFDDVIFITLNASQAMPLHVRIPAWATDAKVLLNGTPQSNVKPGTMWTCTVVTGMTNVTLLLNADIRVESWSGTTASVFAGPLLFSIPLAPNFTVLNSYSFASKDYQVRSLTL